MRTLCGTLLLALFSYIGDLTSTLNYTVYLESWDTSYVSAYQGLVTSSDSTFRTYDGVTLNIGFAAFAFTAAMGYPTNASGLYGTTLGDSYGNQDSLVESIVSYVHGQGGKVQIAYGGASYATPYYPNYFISQTADWPNNLSTLATGVAHVVTTLGLDGIDFDIEDQQPTSSTATEFAAQLTSFLQQVRALLPTQTITLTIPAQGWGQYWQYLAQNVAAIDGLINGINFMEYDIWVNPDLPNGYVGQVEADMLTYTSPTTTAPAPNWSQGWGIPARLIQLGIMPGNDDTQQTMTTTGSQTLTQYAIDLGMAGVFIWDIDRDALTDETPTPFYTSTPYAFSNAIRSQIALNKVATLPFLGRNARRSVTYSSSFVRQSVPPHGQP